MCGVVAVLLADPEEPCVTQLYEGLVMLNHRGQDAAGIATSKGSNISMHKGKGLANFVFNDISNIAGLQGPMGIAHCRYPTAGTNSKHEAQPFCTTFPFPMALAHNGNLTNQHEIHSSIAPGTLQPITASDSELMLVLFANNLASVLRGKHEAISSPRLSGAGAHPHRGLTPDDILSAVNTVQTTCRGAYSVTIMLVGIGIVAFKDPHGIRPLCLGERRASEGRTDRVFASESAALDVLGYEITREVCPGEAVLLHVDGQVYSSTCEAAQRAESPATPCIFEYVYFARPDSTIHGVSVYESRIEQGKLLGEKILRMQPELEVDVVIPIPETSRTVAMQVAATLKCVPFWPCDVTYLMLFVIGTFL
jgi:amidophosphoribosyltransferase